MFAILLQLINDIWIRRGIAMLLESMLILYFRSIKVLVFPFNFNFVLLVKSNQKFWGGHLEFTYSYVTLQTLVDKVLLRCIDALWCS